jgi:CSLREA domain-containing protein
MRPVMFLMAALFVLGVAPLTAQTTFTVTSNNDVDDGTCSVGPGHCSLREAINAANASAATTDTIAFNITGAGPHTIAPGSALPTISDPLVIDGYTQSGASVNTNPVGQAINATLMIVVDGSGAGAVDGLTITAAGCTVRGLVINQFGGHGIHVSGAGASGNLVEGNLIGTDVNGTTDLGNIDDGVFIESGPSNTVGGTTAASRNLISGNGLKGIDISNSAASGNVVQGNYIGTDLSGTAAIANDEHGISIDGAPNNTIGGTAVGAGNVVSGNTLHGVEIIFGGATNNTVQGNLIGTDRSGAASLGNGGHGVIIHEAPNNAVGGTAAGAGNVIAGNTNGVTISGSGATGNAVLSNAIFSNTALGIDLGGDGVTGNDTGDGDGGANGLQNFPVFDAHLGSTIIAGTLSSAASTNFTLQFFSNGACDRSGNGEGETLLSTVAVTTDVSGDATFADTLGQTLAKATAITGTATDANGNTSEFSACAGVADFDVAASPSSRTVTAGQSATYTVTVSADGGSFGESVSLACSGLPTGGSCDFTPSAVTPGATAATSTMTVSTAAASLPPIVPRWDSGPRSVLVVTLLCVALFGLGLALVRRVPRSRRPRWVLVGGGALALALFLGACGGEEPAGPMGPSPQTHTVTVTGTAGSLEHSATVTLTVQ